MTDPLEIAATAFTLISVVLAVKRSLWQFPFGIAGTSLGFFVFWNAQLYSSAFLQPFFLAVLVYGWWFWLGGNRGARPPVRSTHVAVVTAACLVALAAAAAGAWALDTFANAEMALLDASIFCLSVVAQVLLSRKRVENWPVWVVINAISIYVYASQELWLYAALYVFFFFNAFWGWWEWRQAMKKQPPAAA
jgi:nicotinamide mononucleotide transporter